MPQKKKGLQNTSLSACTARVSQMKAFHLKFVLVPVEGVAVDVDIVLRGALPAVVAHHSAPHQLMPALIVLNAPESAANSVLHIGGVVVLEGEAVAVAVG